MLERTLGLRTPELVRRHFNNAEAVGFFPHLRHGYSPSFYGWVLYRFSVTTPLRQSSMLRMSAHSSRTPHSPFSIRCEDVIRRRHRRMARVPALGALSVRRKGVGCRIIVKLGVGPRGISERESSKRLTCRGLREDENEMEDRSFPAHANTGDPNGPLRPVR